MYVIIIFVALILNYIYIYYNYFFTFLKCSILRDKKNLLRKRIKFLTLEGFELAPL